MKKIGFIKRIIEDVFTNIVTWFLIGVLTLVIAYFNIDAVVNFLKSSIQIWMGLLIISMIMLGLYIYWVFKSKRRRSILIGSFRMRTGNEREIPFTYGGMKWIAYIPDQTFRKDEYVWLDGPFCPQCNMKLKFVKGFLKRKWHCPHCDKYFDANGRTESEYLDFVEDMCYAEFFRKGKFSEK